MTMDETHNTEHPQFKSLEEVQQWAKAKEAEFDSAKSRILRRLKWKSQYYEFSKISDQYIKQCKKEQPNSWRNTVIYLEHYVLPFFLNIKASNNPNNWPLFYDEFKNWLEDEALTTKHPERIIAYSTKNHCIKTLNTFLQFLVKRNLMDPANFYKMTGFPSDKINCREADDLISNDEFKYILNKLKEKNEHIAIFFQCAYFTGMRFNEIYGLSLNDIFIGKLEDEVLKQALDDHGINYFGYLVLESQPKLKARARNKAGQIERKPLKGKRKITEKYNRIIPVIDTKLFNNLVKLYKVQQDIFRQRKYGNNPKDYVLFDNLYQFH